MGLLSALETRATSQVLGPPRDPVIAEWFGMGSRSSSGMSVTGDTAMKVTAVFRCVSLRAQTLASLPLTVERHIVATFAWGGAAPMPAHGDLPNGYYFRPEGDELFLMGPLHEEPNVDPDDYPESLADAEGADLAERVIRRVPALERAETRGGWASLYDVSPDWQPVIGEIAEGVFVDAGTSGHGFKLAPALGRHVADLVVGSGTDPGLEQFHPRRFEEERELDAGFGEARILG